MVKVAGRKPGQPPPFFFFLINIIIMEKRIDDYLLQRSLGLNGQIRGAINKKAREENLDLIMITVRTIFEEAYSLGKSVKEEEEILDKLKEDLDIKPKEDGKSGDPNTQKID